MQYWGWKIKTTHQTCYFMVGKSTKSLSKLVIRGAVLGVEKSTPFSIKTIKGNALEFEKFVAEN